MWHSRGEKCCGCLATNWKQLLAILYFYFPLQVKEAIIILLFYLIKKKIPKFWCQMYHVRVMKQIAKFEGKKIQFIVRYIKKRFLTILLKFMEYTCWSSLQVLYPVTFYSVLPRLAWKMEIIVSWVELAKLDQIISFSKEFLQLIIIIFIACGQFLIYLILLKDGAIMMFFLLFSGVVWFRLSSQKFNLFFTPSKS